MITNWHFDRSKLGGRFVINGMKRERHWSCMYAMKGARHEGGQSLVGVATCPNEVTPCSVALTPQALGAPREFTTITVTDERAMGQDRNQDDQRQAQRACGAFWKDVPLVVSPRKGAVTYRGGEAELYVCIDL
ncbi:hypothetical protein [Thalassovita taeanensis]|uniref:Uncharacterized protein n=1 Tax=Thalassovita taeanensis TaxID=657014 RepID=A0A1H9DQ91_9RHOB|nr:hypothetical protein [Thalassovita taeanensis]SEQ15477.1 hypothetical protein SAMN04488092_104238 [Thalassovita taeanensis]